MHEFVHRRMILKVDFGMDRTDEDDEDEGGPRHYAPENDMHTGRGDASNLELIEVGQKNGRESLWIHHR